MLTSQGSSVTVGLNQIGRGRDGLRMMSLNAGPSEMINREIFYGLLETQIVREPSSIAQSLEQQ
jgi:hypothetical protein